MVPPVQQGLVSLFPCSLPWTVLVFVLRGSDWSAEPYLRGTSWNWHMSSPESAKLVKQKRSYRFRGLLPGVAKILSTKGQYLVF